jgi:hexosaminidase
MKKIDKKYFKLSVMLAILLVPFAIKATSFYEVKASSKLKLADVTNSNNIIPKPLSYKAGSGEFILTNKASIYVKGKDDNETAEVRKVGEFLREKLRTATGYDLNVVVGDNVVPGSIYLTTVGAQADKGNEGYSIQTTERNIEITANKPEGLSRGIQTLRQLFPADIEKSTLVPSAKWSVPAVTIDDKPEYSHRGLMLDVARHFFTVDEVKRQIDLAAQYKINKLHLHLSDDQGWRLEIKKWPDLTAIGGSTQVGGGPGGFYTQEQFKDLVQFAADRYVEIIPEFDMPGHSNAALASYGFLNPDGKKKALYTGMKVGFSSFMTHDEKTYGFIEDVIREVSQISPSTYIHIGGDEAQSTKKADYDYFVVRVSNIVKKYGKTPIGWDPIDTAPTIDSAVVLQNWKDSNAAAVQKKMKIVVSVAKKAYLDMKYNEATPYGLNWAGYIPVETGYRWDVTDFAPKQLALGIEAPLWTETISTVKAMDYMIYPRLLGYGEIGWTPKTSRNWEEYKVRLKNQAQRMRNQNINFYSDPGIF